jgi:hypothetical protein
MTTILKKLNWVHVGLILVLPIILVLINPNWIFNASITDDYIYTGYQLALPKYVGWSPSESHYFIERLSVTLPGYVIRQFFSPLIANFVLHLGVYYIAIFSVYGIINKLFNARMAIIVALLFGQYPLILRATGWDYVDGYSMIYMSLSLYCLTQAPHSRRRSLYLLGAGGFYLLMITANLFNLFYAPALAIYLIFLESLYNKPLRLIRTGIFVFLGMAGVYLPLALFYYQLAGHVLLSNSVNFVTDNQTSLTEGALVVFNTVPPQWYLLLTLVAIMLIARLMTVKTIPVSINPSSKHTPEQIQRAVIGVFVFTCLVMVLFRLRGSLYMNLSFYHANIVMTAFLPLGVIFSHKLIHLSPTRFRYVVGGAFFVPMIPFITFTFAHHLLTQTTITIFFIGAVIFALASIILYRTQTIHWLVLFVTFASVPCGVIYILNTYRPQRDFSQYLYEQTLAVYEAIDQRYDSFSLDDFRIWYPPNDLQIIVFQNVSATYLWSWGRRINTEGTTLLNSFNGYDIIVLSSVENNDTFMQQIRDSIERDKFDILQSEEVRATTGFAETIINFIQLRPAFYNPANSLYRITHTAIQYEYLLEESGWNGYESTDANIRFRWTAEPTARLLFVFPQADFDMQKDYRIRFDVINSLEEEVVNSLTLTVNGELLTLTRTDNRYETVISGELLNSPTIELIFQTDRVSNPFDLGIQDGRKLGVAIGELTIAPIADDE